MAFSATEVFLPETPWGTAAGILDGRAYFEIAQIDGAIEVTPAIQVAQHSDNPGAATKIGAPGTSVNVFYADSWTLLTAGTNANRLVRFGWVVKRVSGTNPVSAWVVGTITVRTD